jgi:ribonuclease D
MMEARVVGAGIYEVAQAQLLDPAQALHVRMLEDIKNNFVRQRNKTVNWVVNDFLLVITGVYRWQVANFKF